MPRGLALALALGLAVQGGPRSARAQGPAWAVDLAPFHGTASATWPIDRGWRAGAELGLGVLRTTTLAPDSADLLSVLHAGAVVRRPVGDRASIEAGLRVGVGEHLEVCPASDCLPALYAGGSLAAAWGWSRVRLGTRLLVARFSERTVTAWSPLFVRVRL